MMIKRLSVEQLLRNFTLLSFLCLFPTAQSIFAQRDETTKRGGQIGSSYSVSDIESINNTNGNVMFNIPVASLPAGRGGMSVGVSLTYNSKLWDVRSSQFVLPPGYNQPSYVDSAMDLRKSEQGGWRYGIGYQFEQKERPFIYGSGNPCDAPYTPNYAYIDKYKFVMTFPDGSTHEFRPSQYYQFVRTEELENYYAVDINGTHRQYTDQVTPLGWVGCLVSDISYTGGMTFYTEDDSNLRLFVARDNNNKP